MTNPRLLRACSGVATAGGDGVNAQNLLDDSEGTSWTGTGGVAGKTVTVDLPGTTPQLVSRVQVSGFNGASSPCPYTLHIDTQSGPAPAPCITCGSCGSNR